MITEYIRYDLTAHSAEELIAAYQTAGAHLQAAPECFGFELTRCQEAPNAFILRILWASTEDHLNGFRKSANFPPFLAAIRPFIAEITEMRHYEATGVEWRRG
jgi:heme-degrading monooxygenase HmoA